ncbi:MAG: hypothetical protein LUI07_06070 [Lachnospiraceae bacterium]|nr:hypothetical protein [Lachnospiraceae bacterium]
MDKNCLQIPVTEMTPEIMKRMEAEGLIIRLAPGRHDIEAPFGETCYKSLYEEENCFGPHKIIALTVNRPGFPGFGTHPGNEEFLLIGDNASKPMYILVARMQLEAYRDKLEKKSLTEDDFYLLKARYNDPEVSFFTMRKGIPHGEGIFDEAGRNPSFYVTESRDLPLDICGMGDYTVEPLTERLR